MFDVQLGKVFDCLREQMQSRYPECETCRHKGEKHGMNCMECCPVERQMKGGVPNTGSVQEEET